MADLLLAYRRVGETVEGRIVTEGPAHIFSNVTFVQMMSALASFLSDSVTGITVHRTDSPNLAPVKLEQRLVDLLRVDPAAAIQELSPPPRRVIVRSPVAVSATATVQPVFRAGADTLADAFGEEVYLKVRDGRFEDPATGRWVPLGFEQKLVGEWVRVAITDLLGLPADRFFLPRRWNVSGPWITRAALLEKYEEYMKEIANVHE